MAETTVLRSSAQPRNTSPVANTSVPHVQMSNALPLVQVVMGGVGGKVPVAQNGPGGPPLKQGVVILPPKGHRQNPVQIAVARPTPVLPPLSSDQLLLLRHLTSEYLVAQQQGEGGSPANADLAQATIGAIDQILADILSAASTPAAPPARRIVQAGPRSPIAAAATPRRVSSRPAPPVIIDMDEPIEPSDDVIESDVIDVPSAG